MGIKVIELEDNNGNRFFVNPASVCSISEVDNFTVGDGEPKKLTTISSISYSHMVKTPILEVKKLIFG